MIWVGRIGGWLLLGLAVIMLGRDVIAALSLGEVAISPLGQIWFQLDAASLNTFQAGVERHVSQWLWDQVLAPMLHWWAFVYPLVPGLALTILCRGKEDPKRPGRRRFRRG